MTVRRRRCDAQLQQDDAERRRAKNIRSTTTVASAILEAVSRRPPDRVPRFIPFSRIMRFSDRRRRPQGKCAVYSPPRHETVSVHKDFNNNVTSSPAHPRHPPTTHTGAFIRGPANFCHRKIKFEWV